MVNNNNPLVQILRLIDEVYEAEKPKPIDRGRPRVYQDIVILKVFIMMVIKRITTFKGLHRYRQQNPTIQRRCGFPSVPSRRTLGRRLKSCSPLGPETDPGLGHALIVNGIANAKVTAVDKSMVTAQGPLWHKKDRKKGIVPTHLRNVDRGSQWGYSRYRGWVQGYAIHLLCSATPGFVPFPLDADAARLT
jgi:hypothetical protein